MGTELECSTCDKPVLLSLYEKRWEGKTQIREDNVIIQTILILTFAVKNILTFEGMNVRPHSLCYSIIQFITREH